MKINTDAATFQDLGSGGYGIVARDADGKFLGGGSIKANDQLSPIMMEAQAMCEGLKMAIDQGWSSVVAESDCQGLVEDLGNNKKN